MTKRVPKTVEEQQQEFREALAELGRALWEPIENVARPLVERLNNWLNGTRFGKWLYQRRTL